MSLAMSERQYADENPAFYELIMNLQLSDSEKLKEEASCIIDPIMHVLNQYSLQADQKVDAERAFRACVFGFISQEKHKYFSHLSNDTEQSFLFCINTVIDGIEAMENAE